MYSLNDALYAASVLNIKFDKFSKEEFLENLSNPSTEVSTSKLT